MVFIKRDKGQATNVAAVHIGSSNSVKSYYRPHIL
jgi:hypothetical protein